MVILAFQATFLRTIIPATLTRSIGLIIVLMYLNTLESIFFMTESYFNALEQKIDQILERYNKLEEENQQLREKERLLKEERAQLSQINEQTQAKIEAMITRLKSLEQNK